MRCCSIGHTGCDRPGNRRSNSATQTALLLPANNTLDACFSSLRDTPCLNRCLGWPHPEDLDRRRDAEMTRKLAQQGC
jgi:hypothetical protein